MLVGVHGDKPVIFPWSLLQSANRGIDLYSSFWQPLRQTIDEFLHAAFERHKETPARAAAGFAIARALFLLRPHRPDDTAPAEFHFLEARHGRGEAQLVWIGCIDPAN